MAVDYESPLDRLYKQVAIAKELKGLFSPSPAKERERELMYNRYEKTLRKHSDWSETIYDNDQLQDRYNEIRQMYNNNYDKMDDMTRQLFIDTEARFQEQNKLNNEWNAEISSFNNRIINNKDEVPGLREGVIESFENYALAQDYENTEYYSNKNNQYYSVLVEAEQNAWTNKGNEGFIPYNQLSSESQDDILTKQALLKDNRKNDILTQLEGYNEWHQGLYTKFGDRVKNDVVLANDLASFEDMIQMGLGQIKDDGFLDSNELEVITSSIMEQDPNAIKQLKVNELRAKEMAGNESFQNFKDALDSYTYLQHIYAGLDSGNLGILQGIANQGITGTSFQAGGGNTLDINDIYSIQQAQDEIMDEIEKKKAMIFSADANVFKNLNQSAMDLYAMPQFDGDAYQSLNNQLLNFRDSVKQNTLTGGSFSPSPPQYNNKKEVEENNQSIPTDPVFDANNPYKAFHGEDKDLVLNSIPDSDSKNIANVHIDNMNNNSMAISALDEYVDPRQSQLLKDQKVMWELLKEYNLYNNQYNTASAYQNNFGGIIDMESFLVNDNGDYLPNVEGGEQYFYDNFENFSLLQPAGAPYLKNAYMSAVLPPLGTIAAATGYTPDFRNNINSDGYLAFKEGENMQVSLGDVPDSEMKTDAHYNKQKDRRKWTKDMTGGNVEAAKRLNEIEAALWMYNEKWFGNNSGQTNEFLKGRKEDSVVYINSIPIKISDYIPMMWFEQNLNMFTEFTSGGYGHELYGGGLEESLYERLGFEQEYNDILAKSFKNPEFIFRTNTRYTPYGILMASDKSNKERKQDYENSRKEIQKLTR